MIHLLLRLTNCSVPKQAFFCGRSIFLNIFDLFKKKEIKKRKERYLNLLRLFEIQKERDPVAHHRAVYTMLTCLNATPHHTQTHPSLLLPAPCPLEGSEPLLGIVLCDSSCHLLSVPTPWSATSPA